MIEQGLIRELTEFHNQYNLQNKNEKYVNMKPENYFIFYFDFCIISADYTKGVFQSIGFKEFHKYLMLNEEQQKSKEGLSALEEGIDNLKIATRRYAKKQTRWVINRFLGRDDRQVSFPQT